MTTADMVSVSRSCVRGPVLQKRHWLIHAATPRPTRFHQAKTEEAAAAQANGVEGGSKQEAAEAVADEAPAEEPAAKPAAKTRSAKAKVVLILHPCPF